ncbi:MAG: GNAT family protein [Rubrivivax sp.]|nr:GNAT family protein [Rubrivivax sp.]MDP3224399.1 GNAT family protein [Rubrivivax sp.]
MGPQQVASAPTELVAGRVQLLGPRLELAPLFVASLNLSLPGLRYIGWAQRPRADAWGLEFIDYDLKSWAQGECLAYYAFERDGGAYVGRIDLHSWDFDAPRCEVGYVGDVRTAGRGLMREAVLACVDLAFALGVARVQALSETDNLRALHFAEHALGFKREGVLRYFERDAQGRLGEQVMFAAYNPAAA